MLCVQQDVSVPPRSASPNPVVRVIQEVASSSKLAGFLQKLCARVLTREKLELAVRVLARVLVAMVAGRREAIEREPGVKMVQVAG